MEIEGYAIQPLTEDRFDDLSAVLGKSGIGGCWCTYWIHPASREWGEGATGGSLAANKDLFRSVTATGPPPGLIAYDEGAPVAWCRVMPRSRLPGLERSRYFKTDLDVDGVWSLSCFVVRRSHRGRGLTAVLTRAATEVARAAGATYLEAYPMDTPDIRSPSSVYLGLASTFHRLGFEVVQRTAPHKPMMRLTL